jgi:hypothetical protein
MSGGHIDVTGGSGGTTAALDELEMAASHLHGVAGDVARAAAEATGLAGSVLAALARQAAFAEHLAARAEVLRVAACVEAGLAEVGTGLIREAVALRGMGAGLRAAVGLYRSVDSAVAVAFCAAEDATVATAVLVLPAALPLVAAGTGAARLLGTDPLSALDRVAFTAPGLVDVLGGGLDGGLRALGSAIPALGLGLGTAAAVAGRPFPPRGQADAVAALGTVARLGGVLADELPVSVTLVPVPPSAAAPETVADLVAVQEALGGREEPGRVRVVEVPQPDGTSAWVLVLPGTQDWSPRSGSNPADVTTDVWAMAGSATAAAAGARRALLLAQQSAGRAGRGDPVMLVGHSQGGILAAAIASGPSIGGSRVTTVLTSGAPVAGFPVPSDVAVLSLEHRQDVVPRLDGAPNPDRTSWVTVTRDLEDDPDVRGRASRAHAAVEYAETAREVDRAVESGASPSLDDWAARAAPFLRAGPGAVVHEYRVERAPRAGPPAGWWQDRVP